MKIHLRKLWDSLKSTYWFVPLVMMGLAVILWSGTRSLDNILTTRDKKAIAWLYVSDADTMRTLLLTIAAAIIGIVGVVFSIIMVPLSIAASQFGPRLLRTFLRDTGTQITLGTFTATFIFCMAVLLQLPDKPAQPLPQISVNVALLFGLTSFGVLLYFINHVAVSIQAPIVVARVSKELHSAILHELPIHSNEEAFHSLSNKDKEVPPGPASTDYVMAAKSGYLQARDDNNLLALARQNNLVLQLLKQPGDFINKGAALVTVWPEVDLTKLSKSINEAFILGEQRTLVQDITFGINELVEVAIRALSPAINDPFTAMTCLDRLGSALCEVCARKFPEPKVFDNEGELRLIRGIITFTSLTDAAFNQIREYGRTSTAVTLRLMETIKVVAQRTRTDEQRKALLHHATLVERGCHIGLVEANDQQRIMDCYETVRATVENGH